MKPFFTSLKMIAALRHGVSAAARVLPRQASVAVERHMRGFEEHRRLAAADAVIVSFGKSGRTWLRVMLSRYFARKHGLAGDRLMDFDEFHRANAAIPVLFFTHDNYLKDYLGHARKFETYGKSKVVLLARDPRDTSVSSYFQWKHRMRARKKLLNSYSAHDMSLDEFVATSTASVANITAFLNAWADDLAKFPGLLLVRYEDLRRDTAREMRRILEFLGEHPEAGQIEDCVAYASLDNMREREKSAAGLDPRLRPGDAADPSTFKARRGKVGGWRDEVSAHQAAALDHLVAEQLAPLYGYGAEQRKSEVADGD